VAQRVVLHVGTMKSGTTYIQNGLIRGAPQLDEAGAFYVGGCFRAQTVAVGGMVRSPDRLDPKPWQRLVGELRGRDGVAVFSQEFLSFARPANVAAVMRTLEGLEVDVVVTVRDQRRAIPAQWQTYARNLGTSSWPQFLRELEPMVGGESGSSLALWKFRRAQDVPVIVRRWAGHPGVSSVALVSVPGGGADPTELWRRFCSAARLEVAVPPAARGAVNESLGYASCHVLTRVNRITTALPKRRYRHSRTRVVQALLPLREREGRPELDRAGVRLADALNQRILDVAAEPGVITADSLAELAVEGPADVPAEVVPPHPDEVRRAVERVWEACLPDGSRAPPDVERAVAEIGDHLVAWARAEPVEGDVADAD
jgi:hypothetical protein